MQRLMDCARRQVTQELVQRVRSAQSLPGERNLKRMHVQRLKSAIKECARAFDWSFASVPAMGIFRLNGQHSSAAVSELGEEGYPIEQLVAIETHYECDSITDATRLWSTIDSSMSNRTPAEVIKSLTQGEPLISGLGIRYRKMLSNGLALASGGIKGMRQHASFKGAALVRGLREPVLEEFLARTAPPLLMQPPGVLASAGAVASMLMTGLVIHREEGSPDWSAEWRISQSEWPQYWLGVSTGVGLGPGDPRLQIRNWLVSCGRANRVEVELEIAATCMTNWNHWRSGRLVANVKRVFACPEPK